MPTLVAPFIAVAICSFERSVCIRSDTACSCTRICVNFCMYLRVRTRSLARILHAFCSVSLTLFRPTGAAGPWVGWTDHVARLCVLLDVRHRLLLLLLEFCALTLKLPLRLLQAALMLSQPLGGGDAASEERVL